MREQAVSRLSIDSHLTLGWFVCVDVVGRGVRFTILDPLLQRSVLFRIILLLARNHLLKE